MNFFSIRGKIFLSFASIIILYMGIALTGYYFLSQARNLATRMEPRNSQRTFLYEFTILLSSLETSLDKFFVAGYPIYQEKVNENLENMLDILKTLKRDADRDLIPRLSELENLISELREDTVFLGGARTGQNERIISIYQKMGIAGEKSSKMLSEITGRIYADIVGQKRILSVVINQFIILGVLLLIMGVVISLYLSRLISSPIIEAKNAAIEIGKGNLDTKFEAKTKDEIGELAKAFGQMTSDLKKSRKELEEYSKGLEEKVGERTKELQEKIDELERFQRLAVGRELKMITLKEEIKKLKKKSGKGKTGLDIFSP